MSADEKKAKKQMLEEFSEAKKKAEKAKEKGKKAVTACVKSEGDYKGRIYSIKSGIFDGKREKIKGKPIVSNVGKPYTSSKSFYCGTGSITMHGAGFGEEDIFFITPNGVGVSKGDLLTEKEVIIRFTIRNDLFLRPMKCIHQGYLSWVSGGLGQRTKLETYVVVELTKEELQKELGENDDEDVLRSEKPKVEEIKQASILVLELPRDDSDAGWVLRRGDFKTVGDLLQTPKEEFTTGVHTPYRRQAEEELQEVLSKRGLKFGMDDSEIEALTERKIIK